jgi:predicted AAA+ superfamily ATPase
MALVNEVQRAPELLRAIKNFVGADRRPRCFLLTGPASVLALPQVSESLLGRMEIITLLPLGRSKILGIPLPHLFNG